MQPNTSLVTDLSFTENPELRGTYLALGRQLADGGAESPPETLPLVSILRELLQSPLTDSNRRPPPYHAPAWLHKCSMPVGARDPCRGQRFRRAGVRDSRQNPSCREMTCSETSSAQAW
jgi:hypothetical protein